MATYSFEKIVRTRYVWSVPVYESGACWAEVTKAVRAAHQELWAQGLVPEGKDASDNAILMHFDDEHILVYFEVSREGADLRLV